MDMICSGKYPQDTWCQWDPGSVQPCCLIVIGPYTPVYRCLRYSLDLLNFTSNSSFWLVFLSNFVCGPPSFPVVPQASWHPAGPAAVSKTFRRWAMPLGSSCRYLLALTCSVFSPGQAKEEETTSKEREQGSQSQRWAWEWTLPSSALRQPVRRRWSQGESAWIDSSFSRFPLAVLLLWKLKLRSTPGKHTLWGRGELWSAFPQEASKLAEKIHATVEAEGGPFPPALLDQYFRCFEDA